MEMSKSQRILQLLEDTEVEEMSAKKVLTVSRKLGGKKTVRYLTRRARRKVWHAAKIAGKKAVDSQHLRTAARAVGDTILHMAGA